MRYDLEERTAKFSEDIIDLCKKFKMNAITTVIITQLIKAATSIGANYAEVNGASSRKDFMNKIFICKKEARETKYWLLMLIKADASFEAECKRLWQEAQELTLIFSKIATNRS